MLRLTWKGPAVAPKSTQPVAGSYGSVCSTTSSRLVGRAVSIGANRHRTGPSASSATSYGNMGMRLLLGRGGLGVSASGGPATSTFTPGIAFSASMVVGRDVVDRLADEEGLAAGEDAADAGAGGDGDRAAAAVRHFSASLSGRGHQMSLAMRASTARSISGRCCTAARRAIACSLKVIATPSGLMVPPNSCTTAPGWVATRLIVPPRDLDGEHVPDVRQRAV